MEGISAVFQGVLSAENDILRLFVDGFEENQLLGVQCTWSEDDIVQNISSLLTKSNTRILGLRLLNKYVDKCNFAAFERKANLWTTLALKACNTKELQNEASLTFEVLRKLASRSVKSTELSKSFVSTHLTKIYTALTVVPQNAVVAALQCVETCLQLYSSSTGPSRGMIERFLIRFTDTADERITLYAAKCFHLLQQIKIGGTQGVNIKCQWKNYQIQLMGSIHGLFDEMFANCAETYDESKVQEKLNVLIDIELNPEPVKRAAQLYTRCNNLIQFLNVALKDVFAVEKSICVMKILHLINRGLSVSILTLQQNPIADNLALSLVLPQLHTALLKLLDTTIIVLRGHLRPYYQLILGILTDTLKWTASKSLYGARKPLVYLREKVYNTISLWCKVLSAGSCCDTVSEFLTQEILNDVTHLQNECTLQVLSGARKQMSKKARRQLHKLQNEQSNLSQNHSNGMGGTKNFFSEERNQTLCIAALRCLQEILFSNSNFMKPTTIKLLQINITQICSLFYELPLEPTDLYFSSQCRMEIYNTLYVLMTTPHSVCPPPSQFILYILQTACSRDYSLKVRSHCNYLLSNLEKLVHPQKESLLFTIEEKDIRNTFIRMGKESLLNQKIINSTCIVSSEDDESDVDNAEIKDSLVDANKVVINGFEEDNSEDDKIDKNYKMEIDDISTTNSPSNKEIDDEDGLTVSEQKTDINESEQIPSSREVESALDDSQPASVQNVEEEEDTILERNSELTNEENLNRSLDSETEDLSEPQTKKPKLVSESVPSTEQLVSSENIDQDDDLLLADIAAEFTDELN